MDKLIAYGHFPGGNPQLYENIKQSAKNIIEVSPEIGIDDCPGYKFRCDIVIKNRTKKVQNVKLRIFWNEPIYMHYRQTIYIRKENDVYNWVGHHGKLNKKEKISEFDLEVPPGKLDVSSQPRYDFKELSQLVRDHSNNSVVEIKTYNESSLLKPIYSFSFKSRNRPARKSILSVARIHPYETSGSYCLEGIIRLMAEDESRRQDLTKVCDFIFVPIISPNGVIDGTCRLNGTGDGIDLARDWRDDDPCCNFIRQTCSENNVVGYIEFHNWMHPNVDGLAYINLYKMRKFFSHMAALNSPNKKWKKILKYGFFSTEFHGVKRWVHKNTKATCMMPEYPWHNRTPEDLKALGYNTVKSFSKIL